MRPRTTLGKPAIFTRRVLLFVVRAAVLGSMSFAIGFGFLVGATSRAAHYDPHLFAIGVAWLFGGACGACGILVSRIRQMKQDLRDLETRLDDAADRTWEMSEDQQRAESFLDAQDDVIVRRDRDGRITYANDAFCRLAGRTREELAGSSFAPRVLEHGECTMLADGTRAYDQKIQSSDQTHWIAWREVTIRRGTGSEVQSVGRDVTDRVRAEHALADARDQAEAANRAKSGFLAMVSHEIRTPLNGILGMADILSDTPLTAEQITYLKAVKASGASLLSLIEEILDFSRIESGRLTLAAEPFPLGAMIEEVVELLGPRAQAKGLEICGYVDERLPARVVGDPARLRQVLFNLAGNAIKFTECGGLSIVAEPGEQPDEVVISVHDTGIGISAADQARIFLEFEQGESGPARRFGGSGLGLAISKKIVEAMGGAIAVESGAAPGATFHVRLPLPSAGDPAELSFVVPELANENVLIVAPGALEASLIARRLSRWGARTKIVPDENVAATLLPEHLWTSVLIDHSLGTQACTAFARAAAAIPRRLVLVTPAMRSELAGLKEAGFSGYLIKPVRAASLAARLSDDDAFDLAAAEAVSAPSITPSAGGLAILVAEDNEINALLARALLLKMGHQPTVAANGVEAIEFWRAAQAADTPFDRVLMDVHMPSLDGLEATRRIRALEAETGTARTPILALTANAFTEDREACYAAGMDGFLVKPLDRESLAAALTSGAAALAA
ncbi:MAG: ATP-binding protein [Xanthobacteraceae bacterium]